MRLTVCGKEEEYPGGTTLEKIANDHQNLYPYRIILAIVNGQLKELFQEPADGDVLEFETLAGKSGNMTYQRSLLFLLLKASCDVIGENIYSRISVDFSINKGLYINFHGLEPDQALSDSIEKRMRELIALDLPFEKKTVRTPEAIEHFRALGMEDKVELFQCRIASFTNIYRLGEYEDYYYAYMVPSTGYLTTFALFPLEGGLILQTPLRRSPDTMIPYRFEQSIFNTLKRGVEWSEKLKLRTVGNLNSWIIRGETADLILLQEAYMEHEIGGIAEEIEKKGRRLILIAGPSSSGKTTFSHRLSLQLKAKGLNTHAIACDDYFRDRETYPVLPDGTKDFESIECVDVERLNRDLQSLLAGERTAIPSYDFVSGKHIDHARDLQIDENDVIVLEGIHCLNDALTFSIPTEDKYRIFISALMQIGIDRHNRISTTDARLIRRIVRDSRTRGFHPQDTIAQWDSVRRGEEEYIFPYQMNADTIFNSSLIYELPVLKTYVEPLLFGIGPEDKEYPEAKRLLKFLSYFVAIPAENIPQNSLLREFIGGGCFDI